MRASSTRSGIRIGAVLVAAILQAGCAANTGDRADAAPPRGRAAGAQALKGTLVELWPGGAPGAVGDEEADKPALSMYAPAPDSANGAAVVICPGGAYDHLAKGPEGDSPATWASKRGIRAFVLSYRLAPRYRYPAQQEDVQRAVRMVRARAAEWGVDPSRIGVWGFSAGGHLASLSLTHFDAGRADAPDPIDRVSSRPSFGILAYPVIAFDKPYTNKGSRRNLLGDREDDPELRRALSTSRSVTAQTPPTFLVHAEEDRPVPPQNSIDFYQALQRAGVPAELQLYERGGHGFGLGNDRYPELKSWPGRLATWLAARGITR